MIWLRCLDLIGSSSFSDLQCTLLPWSSHFIYFFCSCWTLLTRWMAPIPRKIGQVDFRHCRSYVPKVPDRRNQWMHQGPVWTVLVVAQLQPLTSTVWQHFESAALPDGGYAAVKRYYVSSMDYFLVRYLPSCIWVRNSKIVRYRHVENSELTKEHRSIWNVLFKHLLRLKLCWAIASYWTNKLSRAWLSGTTTSEVPYDVTHICAISFAAEVFLLCLWQIITDIWCTIIRVESYNM